MSPAVRTGPGYVSGMSGFAATATLVGLLLTQFGVVLIGIGSVYRHGKPPEPKGKRDTLALIGTALAIFGALASLVGFICGLRTE